MVVSCDIVGASSEACSQFVQHVGMRFGIHAAFQDLLGAGYCQRSDLGAQLLACLVDLLFDLGLGTSLHAVASLASLLLGFLDDLVGALVGLVDDAGRVGLGFLQQLGCPHLGKLKVAS